MAENKACYKNDMIVYFSIISPSSNYFIDYSIFFIVIMDKTSFWLKRTIESLKSANKSLKNVSNKKRKTRFPRATNLQKRVNISPYCNYDKGLPSLSLTLFSQIFHPAVNYCLHSTKRAEEGNDEPTPRKKIALANKRTGNNALNKPEKLVEERKTRASDDDIDLIIDRTARGRPLPENISSMAILSELTPSPPGFFKAPIADNPSTEERLKAMDLRQKKLAERLTKIDSGLRSILFE